MFERYTEKARRTIFFARYEASQFGSSFIETEHLLLGLFREDKALAKQFLGSHAKLEDIRDAVARHSIAEQGGTGPKISTSVDLPLSHEAKRVLAYGAEEAERMNHKVIGTPHLLLGLLREERSFGAQLLREQGLTLDLARERVRQMQEPDPPPAPGRSARIGGLEQWLAENKAHRSNWTIKQELAGNSGTRFAIYVGDQPKENKKDEDLAPAEKLAQIQKRIDFISEAMEFAIANHDFERGRFYSDEERKERENLRRLCEQYHLEEPRPRVPLLCIEIIRGDLFSEVRKRCDDYIAEGVAEVWLLDPDLKRAYTVRKSEGLREFQGEILRIAEPPLEMDLRRIFE
jgi:Uma2 family endonuclease